MTWSEKQTASAQFVHTHEWRKLRLQILKRDNHQCQIKAPGCTGAANIVDKILAISEGGNPRDPRNPRAVCHNCHNVETQKQAKRGRNSWKRTPERHPGFKR